MCKLAVCATPVVPRSVWVPLHTMSAPSDDAAPDTLPTLDATIDRMLDAIQDEARKAPVSGTVDDDAPDTLRDIKEAC